MKGLNDPFQNVNTFFGCKGSLDAVLKRNVSYDGNTDGDYRIKSREALDKFDCVHQITVI